MVPKSAKDGGVPVYGTQSCHPAPLQCLASPKAFTANLSIVIFLQVCTFSYAIGMLRTLEKRFGLTSQLTGSLNSVNDIVQVFIVLLVGFFAGKTHKPRVLSLSLIILCAGAFLYAVPYFLFGSKENIITKSSMNHGGNFTKSSLLTCNIIQASSSDDLICNESAVKLLSTNKIAFNIFIIAAILVGIGGSGIQILGISYIDENVPNDKVSLYIAAATAMFPLGPIAGFSFAALATSIPENLKDSTLNSSDPAFIGAWWLGYTVFPSIMAVFTLSLFFFPKHFGEYYIQKKRQSTINEGKMTIPEKKKFSLHSIKDFPKTFLRLVHCREFVTNAMSQIFFMYMVIGVIVNITRYIEIHFHLPAFVANIMAGIAIALAGVIGNIIGGLIMRKLKLELPGAALLAVMSTFITIIGIGVMMAFSCPPVPMTGQLKANGLLDVDSGCAANCTCPLDLYLPVCGETPSGNHMAFLSPCHAGCTSHNGSWAYSDCTCLSTLAETTSRGTCTPPCMAVYGYIVTTFLMVLTSSISRVPSTIVSLRVVDTDLRTFALGFQSFLINLLAFIPGPILFGTLTDSTCLIWSENCGKTGNCLFYDTHKYRLLIHGVCGVFVVVGFIFVVITWLIIRRKAARGAYKHSDGDEEKLPENISGGVINGAIDVKDDNKANESVTSARIITAVTSF